MAREQLAAALTAAVQRLAADGGQPPDPTAGTGVPFAEAIAWHRQRDPLTDEEWRKRQDWYRRRSFTIANVAQLDLVSEVQRAIERAIVDGTTLDDFKKEVGEKLKAAWAGDVKNPAWRLEVIFRQGTLAAYGAGRYYQASDPAVLKRRPYWGLEVVLDDRTTKEICRPLVGTILLASDPWWRVHVPPLHMLCRTVLSTYTEAQAKKRGITAKPSMQPVQDGFGLAPDAIESDGPTGSRWYQEKLKRAPPKLAEAANAKQAGDDVEREGRRLTQGREVAVVKSEVAQSTRDQVLNQPLPAAVQRKLDGGGISAIEIRAPESEVETTSGGTYRPKQRTIFVSTSRPKGTFGLPFDHDEFGSVSQSGVDPTEAMRITLTHELGHHIQYALLSDTERAWIREHFKRATDEGTFVSPYASERASDYFAECFAAYCHRRDELMHRDPTGYDLVRKVIGAIR